MEENSKSHEKPAEYIEPAEEKQETTEDLLRKLKYLVPVSLVPDHRQYMKRAIELAKKSQHDDGGPYVGAVIVKKGKIIAEAYKVRESWYRKVLTRQSLHLCHAEEKAIELAGKEADGATLYVTLEPCTQRNKKGRRRSSDTPCVELIAQAGIEKVVIGMLDESNPAICCRGALALLDSGIRSVIIYNKGLEEELEKLQTMGDRRRNSKYVEYLPKKFEYLNKKDESLGIKKINKTEQREKRKSNRLKKTIDDGLKEFEEQKKRA